MSSHAERIQALRHPGRPVGTAPFDICVNCQSFFPAFARRLNVDQIVAGPTRIGVFLRNGRWLQVSRDGLDDVLRRIRFGTATEADLLRLLRQST